MTICNFDGCNNQGSYNFKDEKGAYCSKHKKDDMINKYERRKCIQCKIKQPSYNYPNLKPEYCSKCFKNGMINVKHKRCIQCKIKHPSYNLQGLKPKYCFDCKLDDMIDVVSKRCIGCKIKRPSYNYPNKDLLPDYCGDCKKDKMINVVKKKCIKCKTISVYNNYDYCAKCDEINKRHVKKHEYFVKEKLEENNVKFLHNKRINIDDCLFYYPDFIIDKEDYIIIVEVDENKHSGYDKQKEDERMEYLKKQFDKPVLFIRYNPDNKKSDVNVLIKTINDNHISFDTIYLFFNKN